jgi:hypothetical protein
MIRALSQHQLSVVLVAYVIAFLCGAVVSLRDDDLSLRFGMQVILIFSLEFVSLALVLVLINGILKAQMPNTAPPHAPQAQDLQEFATKYGAVFVLFLLEYVIIILSCGLKFWRIYAGGGERSFKVDRAGRPPDHPDPTLLDWILYSAENVVPGREHGGILPLSPAARLFSIGQLVGNLAVTILLLKFTVYLLGSHWQ